jgi:phage repressor protein C with HTH and peptisase S24 domain
MPELFCVAGNSMLPTLRPNDLVIALPAKEIGLGDVVVLATDVGLVIKRIHRIRDSMIYVRGDNRNSDSPICNQPLSSERVQGKVRYGFRLPFSLMAF